MRNRVHFFRCVLLLSLLLVIAPTASASVIIDGIHYNLYDNMEAVVTNTSSSGVYTYYGDNYVIPSTVTYDGETYTVVGIDWFAFHDSDLKTVSLPPTLRYIGEKAFINCYNLKNIDIPDMVEDIGDEAFSGCTSLASLTIGSGLEYFGVDVCAGCTGLASIVVDSDNEYFDSRDNCNAIIQKGWDGDVLLLGCKNTVIPNIREIGEKAFAGCTGLTSIYIPSSVVYIGDDAFLGCSGLASIVVDSENKHYDSRDNCNAIIIDDYQWNNDLCRYDDCLLLGCKNTVIPNTVTIIYSNAFFGCKGLTSIDIPESVCTIGHSAFEGCTGLTGNLTLKCSLSSRAFAGCSKLAGVDVQGNLDYDWDFGGYEKSRDEEQQWFTGISDGVFAGCSNLSSVTIGEAVPWIGDSAFAGCYKIPSIDLPNSVYYLGRCAFHNCIGMTSAHLSDSITCIKENTFADCKKMTSITLPKTLTCIDESAFSYCKSLQNITIPRSVTSIGSYAFYNCAKLTEVVIPDLVTSIGYSAFEKCISLEKITFGSSLNTIAERAFFGCTGMKTATSWAITPPIAKDKVFIGIPTGTPLYVPAQSVEAYQVAENWDRFFALPMNTMTGDVNDDGEVNIADINAVIGAILGNNMSNKYDINGDGEVNIADINALINIILKG